MFGGKNTSIDPIDDPSTTAGRRAIIEHTQFLKRICQDWYRQIATALPPDAGPVLEPGSGAGFLDQYIHNLICIEIFPVPGIHAVMDGCALPIRDASLRAVVMVDVFHHLPDVKSFLREAARCVRPGGRLLLIEPWNSPWGRFIYQNFHHEPFEPDASRWEFESHGPLSSANGALPWMVFVRDAGRLARECPEWDVEVIQPFMPCRYLLSGGFSAPSLQPAFLYPAWRVLERLARPLDGLLGMFVFISARRR